MRTVRALEAGYNIYIVKRVGSANLVAQIAALVHAEAA
jgi:hypothetical protein